MLVVFGIGFFYGAAVGLDWLPVFLLENTKQMLLLGVIIIGMVGLGVAVWPRHKNVPGVEVNTQAPSTIRSQPSGGFVQFEDRSIVFPMTITQLHVGDTFKINFSFANKGTRKVSDNQTWGYIRFGDPAKNHGDKLRNDFLAAIKTGYDKFKGQGGELGVGISGWNTAVSMPLQKDELVGLTNGTLKVYFMVGGAWTDETGKKFYWTECEWTDWPKVALKHSVWHEC